MLSVSRSASCVEQGREQGCICIWMRMSGLESRQFGQTNIIQGHETHFQTRDVPKFPIMRPQNAIVTLLVTTLALSP